MKANSQHPLPLHTFCPQCQSYAENTFVIDECIYCENCLEFEGYRQCCNCNEFSQDGRECEREFYCETCADECLYTCEHCGEYTREPYSAHGDDYCQECFYENFTVCDDCGETIYIDRSYCNDNGTYCEGCFPPCNEFEPDTMPYSGGRRFGVEIETSECSDSDSLPPYWGCKEDGSIDGMEFYSCPLSGEEGFDAIDKLCDYAAKHNWEVDRKCGLHIHLDMTSESEEGKKLIAYAALLTQDLWREFCPTRKSSHWAGCIPWDKYQIQCSNNVLTWADTRYVWLNVRAYYDHRTYEIRLHRGTLDAREIKNWVKVWIKFFDWAVQQTFDSLEAYFQGGELFEQWAKIIDDESLVEYYGAKLAVKC